MGRGGGKRGRSPGRGPGRSRGTRRCRSELRVSPADTTSAHSISTGRAPSVPPVCAPPTPRRRDTASDVPAGASAPGTEDGAGAAILAPVGGGQVVNDTGSGRVADRAFERGVGSRPARDQGASGDAGGSRGPSRGRQYPLSLLRRVVDPPASPRSRAKTPLLQLVLVPRTPALQAEENALSSLALLALVLGMRPPVTPALMLHHFRSTMESRRTG